jgi:hypothetical protein
VTVYADDGYGPSHNVSATITATINENQRPMIHGSIVKTPDQATYKAGDTVMFTIIVSDYENDTVNLTLNFDDGSTPIVLTFAPGQDVNLTKYVNHTFDKTRKASYHVVATVDDGMLRYHFVKSLNTQSTEVSLPVKKSNLTFYLGLIAIAVVAALLVLVFLLKRRKGPKEEAGGMEGMKPPEAPPTTPPVK